MSDADATADPAPADDAPGDDPPAEPAGDAAGLGPPGEKPEWLSLDDGEELQWVGRPATASLAGAFLWGLVLLPLLGLGLIIVAAALITVFRTDYVVTNTSLYHKRGLLSTNIESVGLDRIQNTEYTQSFLGKQLGYGTIEISTAGSGGSDLSYKSIENPREVRDLVNRLGNTVGGTAGTTGSASAGGGAGGGTEAELLEELLVELQGVNEAMATVERLLREEHGQPPRGGGATGDTATGGGAPSSSAPSSSAPASSDPDSDAGREDSPGFDVDDDEDVSTASEFVSGSDDEE